MSEPESIIEAAKAEFIARGRASGLFLRKKLGMGYRRAAALLAELERTQAFGADTARIMRENPGGPETTVPHERVLRRVAKVVRVEALGECWEYTGKRNPGGYCHITFTGPEGKAVARFGHRLVYEALVGPIPAGMLLLHDCDNPPCVRPDHLHPGDHAQNAYEASERDRLPKGERRGKITNAQALQVVAMDAAGTSRRDIAQAFGVSPSFVSAILNGDSYYKVTGRQRATRRVTIAEKRQATA